MRQENLLIVGVLMVAVVIGGFFLLNRNQPEPEQKATAATSNEIVPENNMEKKQNIVEIASSNPDFSTLVTAVTAAGLVETLSGEGPFTVFAPTNAAFEKLPKETLEAVLADKAQLTSILTYHVVSGKVMAKDVVNVKSAKTVQGGELQVKVEGSTVMINNAKVVTTDIEASNGVIHVIDTVLIPQ